MNKVALEIKLIFTLERESRCSNCERNEIRGEYMKL